MADEDHEVERTDVFSAEDSDGADETASDVEADVPDVPDVPDDAATDEPMIAESPIGMGYGGAEPYDGWSRTRWNKNIAGVLVVHHQSRDVTVRADGDAALRVLALFARGGARRHLDHLSATTSSAECGWTALDLNGVIGVTWVPGGHVSVHERFVFDPVQLAVGGTLLGPADGDCSETRSAHRRSHATNWGATHRQQAQSSAARLHG
jgi:hypothetical protein